MGHIVGKDVYRKLGHKIDGLSIKVPWNETFHAILKELYTTEEADLIVKMPYRMSTFEQVKKITQYEDSKLKKLLNGLSFKGLVMDLCLDGEYYYQPSPYIPGIFEFTMMRTGGNLNYKEWAKLFYAYMHGENSVFAANCSEEDKVSIHRTLPHEGTIADQDFTEVLDYEKVTSIIENNNKFAISLCSCRHTQLHLDQKHCDVPLENCGSLGLGADLLIRNNLAREVSKSEMLENAARSKELNLVFTCDNVKKNVMSLCSCCGCCCGLLKGIKELGYPNTVMTSSFIAAIDQETCNGCGKCAKYCHINAIEMIRIDDPTAKIKKKPQLDEALCIGCGVCALKCTKTESVKLVKRKQRVLHPETVFDRIILQSIEKGTLQNQIFYDPQSMTQEVLRNILGAFLRLPSVKKALMSDLLRSTFLGVLKTGTRLQGDEKLVNI
ncbi:4Fe-4S dicluster domain-containing protein [Deltaproteobacteria bacterium TL4]